jgi:hypothetical protein
MPSKSKQHKKNAKQSSNTNKSATPQEPIEVPSDFAKLLVDFTRDLSITFPEYTHLWRQWTTLDIPDVEVRNVFEYCLAILPERFFDILYQNDDIFSPDSETNTMFLPGVDFKTLYNSENVSENTKKSIWKYLQVILLSAINSVKNKADFGDTMNIFDSVSEGDLQEKLKETLDGISDFFKSAGLDEDKGENENGESNESNNESGFPDPETFAKSFNFENMSQNAEELHGHLKGLFDGKIGSVAKEMAEEISKDLGSLLGEDGENITSTQDLLKKMIRNPKKLMDLMKSVSNKLSDKMKNGDISQDELMKEATEWMEKMKDMGGNDQFGDLFKNLAKNMGGLGKNTKLDMNAMTRMLGKQSTRERMRAKLEKKKEAQLHSTENPNNFVFRMEGETAQERSSVIRPPEMSQPQMNEDLDQIIQDLDLTNEILTKSVSNKKKKNKGKK